MLLGFMRQNACDFALNSKHLTNGTLDVIGGMGLIGHERLDILNRLRVGQFGKHATKG